MPPVQAHADIVVSVDNFENHTDFEITHEKEHHKEGNNHDKHTNQHHHCTSISVVNDFVSEVDEFRFLNFSQLKKCISFYQNKYSFSYLKLIFHPPKIS